MNDARGERARWMWLAALVAAGALVFWAFPSLPFQDLPAHAGLVALRHRIAASPLDQRDYAFAPHLGPYSLFRALGEALETALTAAGASGGPRGGAMGAARALGTLPVLALPASLLFARARLAGDRSSTAGFFGVALSFGFMTLLGLASYLLAVPLAIVAFTVWLEHLERPTPARAVLVAVLSALVFVAHGFAFAALVVMALVSTASPLAGARQRATRLAALAPAAALATTSEWLETRQTGDIDISLSLRFQGPLDKLSLLLTPTLMTRWGLDAASGVALTVLLGIAAAETRRNRERERGDERNRRVLAAALALFALFVVLPHSIAWFGFVDARLLLVALALLVVHVRPAALGARTARAWSVAPPLAATVVVASTLVASGLFQREAAGFDAVASAVPDGARVLYLPVDGDSDVFTAHPFVHYDKLLLVRGPVTLAGVWAHQGSAVYPTPANPARRLPASYRDSSLGAVDWTSYHLDDWDFVLVRTRPGSPAPTVPTTLEVAAHAGGFWLYAPRR